MSKKVGVVIRQLGKHLPVVSTVIGEPELPVDNLESYFKSVFEHHRQKIIDQCIEFGEAQWDLQIIDVI